MHSNGQTILSYLNPLAGESADVKAQFIEWDKSSKLIQIRLTALLTGIIYLMVYYIDDVIFPLEALPTVHLFHLYLLPTVLILISLLTFSKKLYGVMLVLLFIAPIGATMASLYLFITFHVTAISLAELYLIIIWTFSISGLRLSLALASALLSIAVILLYGVSFPMAKELFCMHTFFVFAAFAFGSVNAFILEKTNKQIFMNERNLKNIATTDSLTGLCNRIKIKALCEMEIERVKRYGGTFSVIFVDIDFFKMINDTYGHHAGDIILQEFSKALRQSVRNIDRIGRWGGEEFIIILPETQIAQAVKVAETLQKVIAQFDFTTAKTITGSFGIAEYKQDDTPETIINRADKGLYQAKDNGRDQIGVVN